MIWAKYGFIKFFESFKECRCQGSPKGLSRNQDKLSSPQEKSYQEIIKNLEVNNVVPKAEQHCYDFSRTSFSTFQIRLVVDIMEMFMSHNLWLIICWRCCQFFKIPVRILMSCPDFWSETWSGTDLGPNKSVLGLFFGRWKKSKIENPNRTKDR